MSKPVFSSRQTPQGSIMIGVDRAMNALLGNSVLMCLAIVVICGSFATRCEAVSGDQYDCHRASGPIEIDGSLDDTVWQRADVISFVLPTTGKEPLSKTEVKMLWDDSYLYVAYLAYDKDIWSIYKDRDSTTCQEDCLECFIQPDPREKSYYNFEINALGTIYDAYNIGRTSGGYDHHRWAAWNCKGLRVGIFIDGTLNDPSDIDNYWQMELAIPFAELPSLNGNGPKVGDIWKFLLARYDFSVYLPDGVELSACTMLKKVDFHETQQWLKLMFVD